MKKMILKNIRITEKQDRFLKDMAIANEEPVTILIRKIINFYMEGQKEHGRKEKN